MNQAFFIGNLTKDPESRTMTNGKQRTVFSLAINRPYTSKDGQKQADFIQFTAYDKTAELVSKYLRKGRKAAVQAKVRTGSYNKDGHTVYTTEFIVENVEFLSAASGSAPQGTNGTQDDFDESTLPF